MVSPDKPSGMSSIHVASLYEKLASNTQSWDTRIMPIRAKSLLPDGNDSGEYLPLCIEIGHVLVNGVNMRTEQPENTFMVLDKMQINAQPGKRDMRGCYTYSMCL